VPPRAARQMPAEWSALMAQVRRTKVLPFPADIRELAAEDALRGEPHTVENVRVWPAATAIEDVRPAFTWTAREGADYTVTLRRAGDGTVVERSSRLTKPRWHPGRSLERGATYAWQIDVVQGGERSILPAPPAPPAIFRVVSKREHEELEAARTAYPDDHLLLGLLYARAGIADAARRELDAAPDPLAARLAAQLPSP